MNDILKSLEKQNFGLTLMQLLKLRQDVIKWE